MIRVKAILISMLSHFPDISNVVAFANARNFCFKSSFMSSSPQHRVLSRIRGGYDATDPSLTADPTTPIQLFVLPENTCPYVQRTHITLHELGIPFDMIEVKGATKPDWYLKINPRGKVPSLRIPSLGYDAVIYESAICNEFLCDFASMTLLHNHNLMPSNDPLSRAKIRLWNDHCDSIFTKTQFTFLMNKDATKEKEMRDNMENALQFYEDILTKSEGAYLLGEDFSLADIHLFPFIQRLIVTLNYWKNYELPRGRFPKLLAWFEKCMERESVKRSSMEKEMIIEVYKRFVEVDYKFGGLNSN